MDEKEKPREKQFNGWGIPEIFHHQMANGDRSRINHESKEKGTTPKDTERLVDAKQPTMAKKERNCFEFHSVADRPVGMYESSQSPAFC